MPLFYILMFVAPGLLIALAIYLHIFYGYWLDYERDRQYINQRLIRPIESIPTLFSFPDNGSRLLSFYVFYALVPLVLVTITSKAWAFPPSGLILTWGTGLVCGYLVLLWMRRRHDHLRHAPDPEPQWFILVFYGLLILIVGRVVYVTVNAQSFQRPLELYRADLTNAWLPSQDMRQAHAALANFQDANLLWAKLQGADLRGANFQGAELHRAKLQGADLRGNPRHETKLMGAKNLTQEQVNTACVNEHTQLPEGLIRPAPCPAKP